MFNRDSWVIRSRQGTEYKVQLLDQVPARLDPQILGLMRLLPEAHWSPEENRRGGERVQSVLRSGRVDASSEWTLTLVVQRESGPIGVFCAYSAPDGCRIRRKTSRGAELMDVPPYINIGPSVSDPLVRGTGIYSEVYKLRLRIVLSLLAKSGAEPGTPLLAGVMGGLEEPLRALYQGYPPDLPLIPREAFEDSFWDQLGRPRPESRPAEVLALRHGFRGIGFKKWNGGPVLLRWERGLGE